MMRYGFNNGVAAGLLTSAGSLAQVIPPSLVLIVLADVLGVSVGDAYKGALVPSFLMVGLLLAYVAFLSITKPHLVPALPPEARTMRGWVLWKSILVSMVPPVLLIFLVLGTIFIGWATPTEGGAMGAMGALILAFLRGRLSKDTLHGALDTTTKLATFVMFILVGSTIFALTFRAIDGDLWIEHLFSLVPGGETGFMIFVSVLVFVLGFFIDFFEIAFILMPLIGPVAENMGINMVWFLVLVGMNMAISFLTPPFGFALFYLRSVAPKERYIDKLTGRKIEGMTTDQIYKGVLPFIAIQVFSMILIFLNPQWVVEEKVAISQEALDAVTFDLGPDAEDAYGGGGLPGLPGNEDDSGEIVLPGFGN